MKAINKILCIIFAAVAGMVSFPCRTVFTYFSDAHGVFGTSATGSLAADITDLTVTDNVTEWSGDTLSDGFLRVNTSDVFSFSVVNSGRNAVDFSLFIELAWQGELSESGKLFVYPQDMDDEAIFQNILDGNSDGAIVFGGDDNTALGGGLIGIRAALGNGFLDGETTGGNYQILGKTAKDFGFKLFLFEDGDITTNPQLYHNTAISASIILTADISGRTTGWAQTVSRGFAVRAVIDTVFPVISEVQNPKAFFVTQGGDINLTDYATAFDALEGDITDRIVVSSSPAFNPSAVGSYLVTYNVTNQFGNAAAPLTVTIVIWDFAKITSGYYHTLALTSHGKVYVWGYNAYGQLGDGTNNDSSTPKMLDSLSNIIDVAAGVGCSYALDADGQAYAWGRNENGRLGDGTTVGKNSPVRVLQPQGVTFTSISGRFATAGGVTADGQVYTWGYGGYGCAGTGATADLLVPTKIALSDVVQLEMGYYNGAAVTTDGRVYTWGDNVNGQLGKGSTGGTTASPAPLPFFGGAVRAAQVSVGWYHMAAVSESGEVYTWGYGADGRLGDGTVVSKNTPQRITLPAPAAKALAGYFHSGVMLDDGRIYFFGQNAYGKHGTGNVTNHSTPVAPSVSGSFRDFSLAYESSFILDGTQIYGMGYGGTGVLGTGNNNNSNVPVLWGFVPPPPQ